MRGQYANKRDRNEAEIVAILRAHGFTVALMDTPVDLLIGRSGEGSERVSGSVARAVCSF